MSTELLLESGWGMQASAFAPLRAALPTEWAIGTPETAASHPGSIWLGWSQGAQRALVAAAGAPPRALVLIAATPRFAQAPDWPHALAPGTVDDFVQGFARQPTKTLQRFLALQAVGDARRAEVLAALRPALMPADTPGLATALDELVRTDLRTQCAAVRCPVLILHGAADALMPLAAAQWLAAQLPCAQLHALPDCGHAPHVSAPQTVAAAITHFVETLPA